MSGSDPQPKSLIEAVQNAQNNTPVIYDVIGDGSCAFWATIKGLLLDGLLNQEHKSQIVQYFNSVSTDQSTQTMIEDYKSATSPELIEKFLNKYFAKNNRDEDRLEADKILEPLVNSLRDVVVTQIAAILDSLSTDMADLKNSIKVALTPENSSEQQVEITSEAFKQLYAKKGEYFHAQLILMAINQKIDLSFLSKDLSGVTDVIKFHISGQGSNSHIQLQLLPEVVQKVRKITSNPGNEAEGGGVKNLIAKFNKSPSKDSQTEHGDLNIRAGIVKDTIPVFESQNRNGSSPQQDGSVTTGAINNDTNEPLTAIVSDVPSASLSVVDSENVIKTNVGSNKENYESQNDHANNNKPKVEGEELETLAGETGEYNAQGGEDIEVENRTQENTVERLSTPSSSSISSNTPQTAENTVSSQNDVSIKHSKSSDSSAASMQASLQPRLKSILSSANRIWQHRSRVVEKTPWADKINNIILANNIDNGNTLEFVKATKDLQDNKHAFINVLSKRIGEMKQNPKSHQIIQTYNTPDVTDADTLARLLLETIKNEKPRSAIGLQEYKIKLNKDRNDPQVQALINVLKTDANTFIIEFINKEKLRINGSVEEQLDSKRKSWFSPFRR